MTERNKDRIATALQAPDMRAHARWLAGTEDWEDLINNTYLRASKYTAPEDYLVPWLKHVMRSVHLNTKRWVHNHQTHYGPRYEEMSGEPYPTPSRELGQLTEPEIGAEYYGNHH